MSKHAIQASPYVPVIFAGTLDWTGTQFKSQTDVTDEAIFAVGNYVKQNFNGEHEAGFSNQVEGFRRVVRITVEDVPL